MRGSEKHHVHTWLSRGASKPGSLERSPYDLEKESSLFWGPQRGQFVTAAPGPQQGSAPLTGVSPLSFLSLESDAAQRGFLRLLLRPRRSTRLQTPHPDGSFSPTHTRQSALPTSPSPASQPSRPLGTSRRGSVGGGSAFPTRGSHHCPACTRHSPGGRHPVSCRLSHWGAMLRPRGRVGSGKWAGPEVAACSSQTTGQKGGS